MKELYNNEMLEEKYYNINNFIKVISVCKIEELENIENYVKKFINFKTFPYVNYIYGELVEDFFEDLSQSEKYEILNLIEKRIFEIEKMKMKEFIKLSHREISSNFKLKGIHLNREKLYSKISGGQYGEMFLNYLFLICGFQKILSKLYLEWGNICPTGIDVPYINLDRKIILLGESKLYKDIYSAIRCVINDIKKISVGEKFDLEIKEWKTRLNMMPEIVRKFFLENKIEDSKYFEENFEKIVIVGMVIADKIDIKTLENKMKSIKNIERKENYEIILLVIPIESKDQFVKTCIKVLEDMKKKVGDSVE